jgi:ribonuclease H2 subunit C
VPKGYKGVVLVGSQKILERKKENGVEQSRVPDTEGNIEEEDDDEEEEEVKIMEEVGEFSEVLVWGHEAIVDDDDTYVRSLEEWIGVAESVSTREILYILQRATANIPRSTRSKEMGLVVRRREES